MVWKNKKFFLVLVVVSAISGLIWSIWLDGIWAALAGCVTGLAFLGVSDLRKDVDEKEWKEDIDDKNFEVKK